MEAKRSWLVITLIFLFIISSATAVSLFVRGYRPNLKRGVLVPTGLLAATSHPKGASVYLNDKLVTATDDTLNLLPGRYRVKILKDGYLPWEKEITIKKEVVKQTEAHLFRAAPDLKPITTTGALNPTLSPDGYQIVYAVASSSAESKNGIWVSELSSRTLNLIRSSSRQLVKNGGRIDWTKAKFLWSPDGNQILALFQEEEKVKAAYLLSLNQLTEEDQLRDVSFQLELILNQWQKEREKELVEKITNLPLPLQQIATQSAALITFSPDEKKFFYLATKKTRIPENLLPHPPARSDQKEEREIKPGNFYVYDLKEDTNFFLISAQEIGFDWQTLAPTPTPTKKTSPKTPSPSPTPPPFSLNFSHPPLSWLATSRHLIFIKDKKIQVIEADGTNRQTLYAGPFIDNFVFPWPDGSKLVILTSLHSDLPPNLYAVTIK